MVCAFELHNSGPPRLVLVLISTPFIPCTFPCRACEGSENRSCRFREPLKDQKTVLKLHLPSCAGKIGNPEVEVALRFSSHLLVGLCKIYMCKVKVRTCPPRSASYGLTDFFEVDTLSLRYTTVNIGAETSPGSPNGQTRIH